MTDLDTSEKKLEPQLSDIEARVLGCLMEKQLTTPDVYPLTLNSLVTACNQKTSREPVMNLQNGEVQRCINELESREFIAIEYGSRADKYEQKITRKLHFDKADQAVFCLLFLRGPQTLSELLSRSKRMFDFGSTNDVKDLIERHLAKLNPLLMTIPAQAGQREDRFMHLLCGEPDLSAYASASKPSSASNSSLADLEARVEVLESQVRELMSKLNNQ